jgi:hypothetical protein
MVAVPYPLGRPGDSATDRFLGHPGWGIRPDPAEVMTAAAAVVAQPQLAERVDLDPEPSQAWLDHYHYRVSGSRRNTADLRARSLVGFRRASCWTGEADGG